MRLSIALIPALLVASILSVGTPQFARASVQEGSQAQSVTPLGTVTMASEPWDQFRWCDYKEPSTFNSGTITTAMSTSLYGRLIELRYDTVYRCAWGKISNGSPGDEIWVDRTNVPNPPLYYWEPQLGKTQIYWGRDTHTLMFDDRTRTNGRTLFMRACGKAGDRDQIACTGWW